MSVISEILPPGVTTWAALRLPNHSLTDKEWLSVYEMLHYGAVRELFDAEHTALLNQIKEADERIRPLAQQLEYLYELRNSELVYACEFEVEDTKNIIAFPARFVEEVPSD